MSLVHSKVCPSLDAIFGQPSLRKKSRASLELLGKHLGLFTGRLEPDHSDFARCCAELRVALDLDALDQREGDRAIAELEGTSEERLDVRCTAWGRLPHLGHDAAGRANRSGCADGPHGFGRGDGPGSAGCSPTMPAGASGLAQDARGEWREVTKSR